MPAFVFQLKRSLCRSVVRIGVLGNGKSEINLQGDEADEEGEEYFGKEHPHSNTQHLTEDPVWLERGTQFS